MKLVPFDGELDPIPDGMVPFEGELDKDEQGFFSGAGEAALNLGTSAVMAPIAGIRGLFNLATGSGLDGAVAGIDNTMEQAYQPKRATGQRYAKNVGDVLNLPPEYLGKAGEYVAGNEGRLIGEIAGNFITDLLPIGALAKGASGKKAVKPTTKVDAIEAAQAAKQATPAVPEVPLTDTRSSAQLSREAVARATREKELQRSSAFNRPDSLPDLAEAETPMARMVRELGGDPDALKAAPDTAMTRMAGELSTTPTKADAWQADDAIARRQDLMENSVAKQTALEQQAGEYQRQMGGDTGYAQWKAERDRVSQETEANIQQQTQLLQEQRAQLDAAKVTEEKRARAEEHLAMRQAELEKAVAQQRHWDEETRVRQMAQAPLTPEQQASASALKNTESGLLDPNNPARGVDTRSPEVRRNMEIETMYANRPQTDDRVAARRAQEEADATNQDYLQSIEEQLRDSAYKPTSDVQGPKTRASLLERLKASPISNSGPMARQRGAVLNPFKREKTQLENLEFSGDGTAIPDDPKLTPLKEKMLKEKDSSGSMIHQLQSGATSMASKTGSTLVRTASRIIQNANKRADLIINRVVRPSDDAVKSLSRQELIDLGDIFKKEMFNKKRYDPEVLAQHLNTKQLDAYVKQRDMFDAALKAQNEARVAKGKKPIEANEAYMSSRWHGDFRRPVFDKEGNIAWYLASNSKLGLESQTKALLKEFPELKIDKSKDHQVKSGFGKQDIESAYSIMLDVLGRDDPSVQKIKDVVEAQEEVFAGMDRGQTKHHKGKANVRGFVGDRPNAKNPFKESVAMFEQQSQYARNAIHWSEMQKAGAGMKELLADPDLAISQPNNVAYAREYFRNALGQNESKVTRELADSIREGLGISPKVLSDAVGDVKSFFILQKLAVSSGFMLANVVQTSNVLPYLRLLSTEGFKGNPIKDLSVGLFAGPMMAFGHYAKYAGADPVKHLPNQFLKDAFKYAEDNGVIARSILDESPIGAGFSATGKAAKALGTTLTLPEALVRSTAFMTYAQRLKDSGKFKNSGELFQKAEELVNESMVDYRETERAMAFNKMGTVGNALNTLQTFPMSFYNQYNRMAREALRGSVTPLLTMLAVQTAVAGAMGVPYLNDLEKLYTWIKDEKVSNSTYKAMQDSPFLSNPKMWLMDTLGKGAVYGALSEQTGLGLTSRVAAPSAGDMIQAPGGPFTDLAKQGGNLVSALTDPTNETKWAQFGMGSVPVGLQGLLETSGIMKDLTYTERPDGTRVYKNSTDLKARTGRYNRTPEEDTIRKFGIRSQKEVVQNELDYMVKRDENTARKRAGTISDDIYDAARRGDKQKVGELMDLYIRLTGKEISKEQWDKQIDQEFLSNFERSNKTLENSESPQKLLNAVRTQRILKGN